MKMEIKENNIIFLLGAGCSKEAEIPISNEMVTRVQEKLLNESTWKPYTDLYFYLKSSINYSDGIFGIFDNTFNIEKLLIVMGQIEQRDKNIIYHMNRANQKISNGELEDEKCIPNIIQASFLLSYGSTCFICPLNESWNFRRCPRHRWSANERF